MAMVVSLHVENNLATVETNVATSHSGMEYVATTRKERSSNGSRSKSLGRLLKQIVTRWQTSTFTVHRVRD